MTDLRTLGEVATLNRPRIQNCVIWITSRPSRSGDTGLHFLTVTLLSSGSSTMPRSAGQFSSTPVGVTDDDQ
jgi:hypothetical protein